MLLVSYRCTVLKDLGLAYILIQGAQRGRLAQDCCAIVLLADNKLALGPVLRLIGLMGSVVPDHGIASWYLSQGTVALLLVVSPRTITGSGHSRIHAWNPCDAWRGLLIRHLARCQWRHGLWRHPPLGMMLLLLVGVTNQGWDTDLLSVLGAELRVGAN